MVWTSDETGARDRLAIQFGFLRAFGPHVMSSWVTDLGSPLDRPTSFEFRFVVAMAGVLGIGSDLLAWTDAERARAAELIKLYRDIRSTVHTGRVQRHGEPTDSLCAIEYATDEQVVILVWARPDHSGPSIIRPNELDPEADYHVRGRSPSDRIRLGSGITVPFDLAPDTEVITRRFAP